MGNADAQNRLASAIEQAFRRESFVLACPVFLFVMHCIFSKILQLVCYMLLLVIEQGYSVSCTSPASAIALSKIAVAGGMLSLLFNLLY